MKKNKVLAFLLIIIMAITFTACDKNDEQEKTVPEVTESETEAEKATSKPTIVETTTEVTTVATIEETEAPPKTIALGDSIETNGFVFTFERADIEPVFLPQIPPPTDKDYNVLMAKDHALCVYITFHIENKNKEAVDYFSYISAQLVYGDGYTFDADRYHFKGSDLNTSKTNAIVRTRMNPLDTINLVFNKYFPKEKIYDDEPLKYIITIGDENYEYVYTDIPEF
jgi:hypothetical protein